MGYLLLAVVAMAGLLASAACHLMGWFHVEPPWGKSVFVLHVGFLILWFPLVIFANRTMPKGAKGNLEHLLAELPKWVRRMVTGLFIYTLLNFAYFMYCTSQYPRHGVPFYIEMRGFSGHWILFYGMAAVGFVALARLARKRKEHEAVT
jgi:ABC-type multidrug transport system permease subunit